MYGFVDRPVTSLCNGGRFLLWAMRSWTQAFHRGHCPPHAIARGFGGMGALVAVQDFHIAMALLNRDGLETISVAPLEHSLIMEHEAVLLALWRDLANSDPDRMRATFALLVEEDAIAPLSRAMTLASAKLVAAGFDLGALTAEPQKEMK